MPGYLYIFKNRHINRLVKIGFTERDPATRAAELSASTNVPGKFDVVSSWLVAEAASVEKKVHLELAEHRRSGEFFELTPEKAKALVTVALKKWEIIDRDGLSYDGRKVRELERLKAEERRKARQHERDVSDFDLAVRSIVDELERRERCLGGEACRATEMKGFLSILKSSDTPERRSAIREAVKLARDSLAADLALPWLFVAPAEEISLPEDIFILLGGGISKRSMADLHAQYKLHTNPFRKNIDKAARSEFLRDLGQSRPLRLPKGAIIDSAAGWEMRRGELVNAYRGCSYRRWHMFSEKNKSSFARGNGRWFSAESNLGAYHSETLRIIVGEIPGEAP